MQNITNINTIKNAILDGALIIAISIALGADNTFDALIFFLIFLIPKR